MAEVVLFFDTQTLWF